MNRFMVCLLPTLLFWWTPIATVLPLLEARPVTVTPSGQAHKDVNTTLSTDESYRTGFGIATAPFQDFSSEELDSFIDNFTMGNSPVPPTNEAQPEDRGPVFNLPMLIFMSVVMGIYSIVGTVGNGLVILAFCTYRQVRTSANTFILSIAISDILMTGLQYPAGIVSMIIGAPSLGEAMCPILGATLYFSIYVSFLSVMLIAFNKCIHITKPLTTYTKLFGPLRSLLWVLMVWIVSGLLVVPGFLGYGKFGWAGLGLKCAIETDHPYTAHYFSNIFLVFWLLILIIVGAIYLRIYFFVKDSVIKMAEANPNLVNREQYVSNRVIKQTKHMFIIFCAFAVSTAPFVLLLSIHLHKPFLPWEMHRVIVLIYSLNHVMNPFLYAWKLRVFRRAFKALIRCKRHLPFQPGAAVN